MEAAYKQLGGLQREAIYLSEAFGGAEVIALASG